MNDDYEDDDEGPPPPYPVEFSEQCHDSGDVGCAACSMPYPKKCACGGLVHADINWERGQYLGLDLEQNAFDHRCDRCGLTGQSVEARWKPTPEEQARIEALYREKTGLEWPKDPEGTP